CAPRTQAPTVAADAATLCVSSGCFTVSFPMRCRDGSFNSANASAALAGRSAISGEISRCNKLIRGGGKSRRTTESFGRSLPVIQAYNSANELFGNGSAPRHIEVIVRPRAYKSELGLKRGGLLNNSGAIKGTVPAES